MDPDELTKEVYAYFGLAIYGAQVLEHGLANAMVFSAKLAGRLPTLADYDAFLEEKFERTLGALIKDLANHIQVDPTLETCLATALRKRNWLAHRYFRERALDFVTESGCVSMIAELKSAHELFMHADAAVGDVVRPLAAQVGVTDDKLDAYVAQLLEQADRAV